MFEQFANSVGISLVIILCAVFAQILSLNVSKSRYKHGIKTPATTGNLVFERSFRAHLNYIENLVVFLPIFVMSVMNSGADYLSKNFGYSVFVIGLVWLLAKIISALNYINNWNQKIGIAMYVISFLCLIILLFISLSGMWALTEQIMNPAMRMR
jgi:glutathione S-transferase